MVELFRQDKPLIGAILQEKELSRAKQLAAPLLVNRDDWHPRMNLILCALLAAHRDETLPLAVWLLAQLDACQEEVDLLQDALQQAMLKLWGFLWLSPQGRALLAAHNLTVADHSNVFWYP